MSHISLWDNCINKPFKSVTLIEEFNFIKFLTFNSMIVFIFLLFSMLYLTSVVIIKFVAKWCLRYKCQSRNSSLQSIFSMLFYVHYINIGRGLQSWYPLPKYLPGRRNEYDIWAYLSDRQINIFIVILHRWSLCIWNNLPIYFSVSKAKVLWLIKLLGKLEVLRKLSSCVKKFKINPIIKVSCKFWKCSSHENRSKDLFAKFVSGR